jgi:hypothetical protein
MVPHVLEDLGPERRVAESRLLAHVAVSRRQFVEQPGDDARVVAVPRHFVLLHGDDEPAEVVVAVDRHHLRTGTGALHGLGAPRLGGQIPSERAEAVPRAQLGRLGRAGAIRGMLLLQPGHARVRIISEPAFFVVVVRIHDRQVLAPGDRFHQLIGRVGDDGVAEGVGQEVAGQVVLRLDGDDRALALDRHVAREDRDDHPHEVKAIAGHVGLIVAHVIPA